MYRFEPMPSPNGTNHAGLFIRTRYPNPTMAMDAALPRRRRGYDQEEEQQLNASEAIEIIEEAIANLKPGEAEDVHGYLSQLCSGERPLMGPREGEDEPLPFSGRPRPGGEMDRLAQDRAVRFDRSAHGFLSRFPEAGKIRSL